MNLRVSVATVAHFQRRDNDLSILSCGGTAAATLALDGSDGALTVHAITNTAAKAFGKAASRLRDGFRVRHCYADRPLSRKRRCFRSSDSD
jgi:hypothetical protein